MMMTSTLMADQHRAYYPSSHYYYPQTPHYRNPILSVQSPTQLLQPSYSPQNSSMATNTHLHTNPGPNQHRMQLSETSLNQFVEPQGQSVDGFPTRQQFEELLNDYILSLSPKKRDKALIPQKRYDNILAVLKDPKCTTIESAQFRFWAKKMFRLSTDDDQCIVCHEGKPVAVREKLYSVLTESHGRAQHGGRDKTSAEVRKQYSWVPKELIARFVRNCPSCTMRRSSQVDYPMGGMPKSQQFEMMVNSTYTASTSATTLNPILRTSNDPMGTIAGPTLGMTSASMPQLQALAGGSGLLPPSNTQDVTAGSYQYTNGFATSLAEAASGIPAAGSTMLDPRSVFRGPQ